jgi:6-pyruvoyl-tetrahydropterin synthase
MYRVGIKRKFKASHFLVGDFQEETQPHEHEYVADWTMEVEDLDENGFSVDISLMEDLLEDSVDSLSGVLLNDIPFFQGKQTSVENTAEFLLHSLFQKWRERGGNLSPVIRAEMRVWESDFAWASFVTEGPDSA